tara:strand:+ start:297 stop:443 length:147 start_codon:yes stop_codon:yes gene_type:complete
MKARKLVFAVVTIMAIGLFASCETSSTAEEDQLYEQSIDTKEVKNEDT